jgi:hypothetical protein
VEGALPVIEGKFHRRGATRLRILAIVIAALVRGTQAAETLTNEPAQVKISGFGFLGNREMVRLLRNFQPDDRMPVIIDRTFVEDAALVLLARAQDEGHLRATLPVTAARSDPETR